MGDIVKFTESTVGELDAKLKDVRIPRANLGPARSAAATSSRTARATHAGRARTRAAASSSGSPRPASSSRSTVARELIKTGRTEQPVTGFKGRSGKSFRARLALQQSEEGKWRVEFDEPWAREGAKPPEAEDPAAAAVSEDAPAAAEQPAAPLSSRSGA